MNPNRAALLEMASSPETAHRMADKASVTAEAPKGSMENKVPDQNDPVYKEIVRARVGLLFGQAFFGQMATRLVAVEAPWCRTAATDGRHLYYNREFIKGLTKAELTFLIAHEVLHCFPAGTIIPGTYKPIEQIVVGDPVIGVGGKRSTVTVPMSRHYEGDMVTIKARGMLPIRMTTEHPVVIARPKWKTIEDKGDGSRGNIRVWSDLEWVGAGSVEPGDWVMVPRMEGSVRDYVMQFEFTGNPWSSPSQIHDGVLLDQEVADFIGYYVAEGSTTKTKNGDYQSSLAFSSAERDVAERLRSVLDRRFGVSAHVEVREETNSIVLHFSSSPLGRWLREHCGHGSHGKRIPAPILENEDLEILRSFMRAYIDGDGHVRRGVHFGTVSEVLALQMQMAGARFGVLFNLHKRRPASAVIRGRTVESGPLYHGFSSFKDAFALVGKESPAIRSTRYAALVDGAIMTPVTSVTREPFVGTVYNVETSCHTYAAGNVMTHNCVFDHLGRRGGRDPKLWKMANDYLVNYILVKEKVGQMPSMGLYDKQYTDEMSSEEIYELLKKNSVTIKLTLDDHLELGNDSGSDEGKSGGDGVQITITGAPGEGPPKLSEEDLEKIRRELKAALIQTAQSVGAGKIPAGIKRMIDDLIEPKMDWRALLDAHIRSSVKDDYTFQRPSRRAFGLGGNIILPAQDYMNTVDIAIAIDTSGSMTSEMLRDFVSEVKGIMETFRDFRVKLWTFDTEVYSFAEFTPENIHEIDTYEPKGGGGTTFEANWAFMKREGIEPERFVMFTDGYPNQTWGDENYCDTLFVIHGSTTIVAPFGMTAYYEAK